MTAWADTRRFDVVVLALLVALGVVLRLIFMAEPLRFDEAFTLQTYAWLDAREIPYRYDTPNNQIVNTLLMHVSRDLVGEGLWGIRLPGFLAGVLVPIAAFFAGLELYGRAAAFWAAGLTATSLVLVDFSVNGRGYIIGILFLLIALAAAARIVRGVGQWPALLFVVAAALAIWSVPTMGYGVIVLGVWMAGSVLLRRRPDPRRLLSVAGILVIAAALAGLLVLPLTNQPGWSFVQPLPRTWEAARPLIDATWDQWRRGALGPLEWLIVLAFLASVALHRRIARVGAPLALAAIVGLVGIVVATEKLGPFPRSWIAFVPLYLVAAGGGFAGLVELARRRWDLHGVRSAAPLAVLVVLLGLGAARSDAIYSEEVPQSDNELADFLRAERPGEPLLIDYSTFGPNIDHHLKHEGYGVGVGRVVDEQVEAGKVLTVVARDQADQAKGQVAAFGGEVTGDPPVPVRHFKYISVYEVRLAPE